MKLRALTIIEILIVISILLILTALIFPTISRALFQGKRTASLSNLKQVYYAVSLYAESNDDLLGPSLCDMVSGTDQSILLSPTDPFEKQGGYWYMMFEELNLPAGVDNSCMSSYTYIYGIGGPLYVQVDRGAMRPVFRETGEFGFMVVDLTSGGESDRIYPVPFFYGRILKLSWNGSVSSGNLELRTRENGNTSLELSQAFR